MAKRASRAAADEEPKAEDEATEAAEVEAEETPPEDEAKEETTIQVKDAKEDDEPAFQPRDLVRVRVHAERGMLGGQAVFYGETHTVFYAQYVEARQTGGEAYALIGRA